MISHPRILSIAVLVLCSQLSNVSYAASFNIDAPFYQLKSIDFITICQSYSEGCDNIPAGDYLLDTWDANWEPTMNNEPVTVASDGPTMVPRYYQRTQRESGIGTSEAQVSCNEGDFAISMTCGVFDVESGEPNPRVVSETLNLQEGTAICYLIGGILDSRETTINASVVCTSQ